MIGVERANCLVTLENENHLRFQIGTSKNEEKFEVANCDFKLGQNAKSAHIGNCARTACTNSLPDELKSSLPTIEEIEAELGGYWE